MNTSALGYISFKICFQFTSISTCAPTIWAVGLLQNSLLYRFVSDHIPTDSERSTFIGELLDLAGAAAERAAAGSAPEGLVTRMEPPAPPTPGMAAGTSHSSPTFQIPQPEHFCGMSWVLVSVSVT